MPIDKKRPNPVIVCETCGKEFTVYPSTLIHDPPRFCSSKCFYKWLKGSERSPRVETNCLTCDKPMRVLKSHYDKGYGRYCSRRCAALGRPKKPKAKMVKCTCQTCGKEFEIYPSWVKKGEGKFCSRQCVISHTNRHMRLNRPTSIEQIMIDELDRRKIKYEFSYSLPPWVIDFAFPDHKLAVEADGIYWHSLDNVQEKDARKDKDLHEQGWTVLHFSGDDIRDSVSDCVDKIQTHLS